MKSATPHSHPAARIPHRLVAGGFLAVALAGLMFAAISTRTPAPLVFDFDHPLEQLRLKLNESGEEIRLLTESGEILLTRPSREVSKLTIGGNSLDNTLTVDFSNGDPIPPGGLDYHGRDEVTPTGDAIALVASSDQKMSTSYQPTGAKDGILRVTREQANRPSVIAFTGLEPVIDAAPGVGLVNGTGAADSITITDPAVMPGDRTLIIPDGFESIEFGMKGEITVSGQGGADLISINDLTGAGPTIQLAINGNEGADIVEIHHSNFPLTTLSTCEIVRIAGVGPGVATTQALQMIEGLFLEVDLNSAAVHDQLTAMGNVDLGQSILRLLPTFIPAPGDDFVIIDSSGGISGTFVGLPEGAEIPGGINGMPSTISYVGGTDGKDVVLTVSDPPPVVVDNSAEIRTLKRKIRSLERQIKKARNSKKRSRVRALTKKLNAAKRKLRKLT